MVSGKSDGMSDGPSDVQRSIPLGGFVTQARAPRDELAPAVVLSPRVTAGLGSGAAPIDQPEALRELLESMLHSALRSGVSDASVHDSMRRACAIAREVGVQPEYMLVGLKRTWREMPEVRRMLRDAREAALSGLITLCIEEYYAPLRGKRPEA